MNYALPFEMQNINREKIKAVAEEIIQHEKSQFQAKGLPSFDLFKQSQELFPKKSFPWDVLPIEIADILKELARSCATSPDPLPGVAFAILGSVLGSTISISPKISWVEPLIFWFIDIRNSGEGKTPAARKLCSLLYERQQEANKRYQDEIDEWNAAPKKDRGETPRLPRGYYATDLTLEGLRMDHSGHGGKVIILDELSAFINSQNQYKGGKGSDRESWLALHDGHPARIVRAGGKTVTIDGARISIFGGVQPVIWAQCFGGENQTYLSDGTIFRFLPVFSGEVSYPMTNESWGDESESTWIKTLSNAFDWADRRVTAEDVERKNILLTEEAQKLFNDWGNELRLFKKYELHETLRGYIPKMIGYVLRLAGIIHCLERFSKGQEPGNFLGPEDIEKGISVVEFHLGHAVAAIESLMNHGVTSEIERSLDMIHLGVTLNILRRDVENGKLSVGFIHRKYNENCPEGFQIGSPKALGGLIRRCGLIILDGKHDLKTQKRVKCLNWNDKTETFIQECLGSLESLETEQYQPLTDRDNAVIVPRMSRCNETNEISSGQSPEVKRIEIIEERDKRDKRDISLNGPKNMDYEVGYI